MHQTEEQPVPSLVDSTNSPDSHEDLTVTVVVCTRNRGALIVDCVRSILSSSNSFVELIVLDQSTNDLSEQAVGSFLPNPRLRYIKSESVGTGFSRNAGVAASQTDIVAFTDDDCVVAPDWLDAHLKAFRENQNVILTFGTVIAPDFDRTLGYIPIYTINVDRCVRTLFDKCTSRGIGANSAVRRRELLAIGAYDPLFGPGSYLQSGEDVDMTIRVILRGYEVYECKDSVVTHFGFRNWADGSKHSVRDMIAIGAACAKPLKLGRWDAWCITFAEIGTHTIKPLAQASLRWKKPFGWRRFTSFLKGFWTGWQLNVDRETFRYERKPRTKPLG